MCLGVPGKVLSVEQNDLGIPMGKVSFGGIAKEVCFAYVPEAEVGEYVIVHAGFALSRLDEEEAQEVFDLLAQLGEVEAELAEEARATSGATS
jgi:hydrogenase expression/formation protein HypC